MRCALERDARTPQPTLLLLSHQPLQHVVLVILASEEDGEDADALHFFVDEKVDDGAVFSDAAQTRDHSGDECALMWCHTDAL